MHEAPYVSWFADISLKDRPLVGGKGGSLGELTSAGLRVPGGFVVNTRAFDRCIEAIEREAPVRAQVEALVAADLPAITACARSLRGRLESAPLPEEVLEQVSEAHARLCGQDIGRALAVRSSATTEDAVDASFAGLQDTYLWISGAAEVIARVRSCWASLYSVESISYRRARGLPEQGVSMAVVVQQMVDARCAGVMFTRSPTTGDRSVITIEGAWGLGSAVVGGEVTPDRWVLGKITGDITVRDVSDKSIQHLPRATGHGIEAVPVAEASRRAACLSDAELQSLRDLARAVERHYGRAQDIEWAVDRHTGQIVLLQSRPETVWSSKEASPVARGADNPLSHVMSIFGGRR